MTIEKALQEQAVAQNIERMTDAVAHGKMLEARFGKRMVRTEGESMDLTVGEQKASVRIVDFNLIEFCLDEVVHFTLTEHQFKQIQLWLSNR